MTNTNEIINDIINGATETVKHIDETYFDIISIDDDRIANTKQLTDTIADTIQKHFKNAIDFDTESMSLYKCKTINGDKVKMLITTTKYKSALNNNETVTVELNIRGLNHDFTRKFEFVNE